MYDFARRPLWIVSHVLVAVAVLVMVRLGFWQMSRWQEEDRALDRIEAGLAAEPVPLWEVVDLSTPPGSVDEDVSYRRVVVEGTWAPEDEVVVRNRSEGGSPGGWVLTPLVTAEGTAVAVVRGWVPLDLSNEGGPVAAAAPAEGPARVVGPVLTTQSPTSLGPKDPAEGRLDSLARVDLERYSAQVGAPLAGVWVMADDVRPPGPEVLVPVEPELPNPSQNVSYMVQWFLFATIAAVGYVLILRRMAGGGRARGRVSEVPVDDAPPLQGDSVDA